MLFAANMFVGRTGFFGFALAIFYLMWYEGREMVVMILKILFVCCLVFFILYRFLPSSVISTLNDSVFTYAFQILYNFNETGQLTSNSTDRVQEMWNESFDIFTFLLGDGQFINPDGTYYRHVDVGFLRQLFYGGIGYVVYSGMCSYRLLTGFSKHTSIDKYKLEIVTMLYLLIIHAKGLDIMYAPEVMLIVFFYYIDKYTLPPNYNNAFHS